MNPVKIRTADVRDAKELLKIYGYYVEDTAITFAYAVPTVNVFQQRIASTLEKYPYLVAARDGQILGYAYGGPFIGRAAYDWSASKNWASVISMPASAFQRLGIHLTQNSALFHAHLGYVKVGEFRNFGYKFHRWYHMIWMEKIIGPHQNPQPPIRHFPGTTEKGPF